MPAGFGLSKHRHTESDLTLTVAADRLEEVTSIAAVAGRCDGAPETRSLHSVHFDTPDHRLREHGATLRVLRREDGFVQTLTSGVGAARAEWDWPVAGPLPDLGVIAEEPAAALIARLEGAEPLPLFETRVERRLHRLDCGAIELAVDRGEIVGANGATEVVSEIELKLKAGEAAQLYRLAQALAESLPVRVEGRDWAVRGFALAGGGSSVPVKAGRLHFRATITLDSAMAAIFANCFDQLTANEACVRAGDDVEGVHQARVGLRRLRSAVSLFRVMIPPVATAPLLAEIKWLAGVFGPAREWDVFLTELLAPVRDAFAVHPELRDDLDALRQVAEERRREAYTAVHESLASRRYTLLRLRFGEWLAAREWRDQPVTPVSAQLFWPLADIVPGLLDGCHRKARKAGAEFAHLSFSQRHRLRISLKKLRYAAEFFRSLSDDKPTVRFINRLSVFQDSLGHLNDISTTATLAPELAVAAGADAARVNRALGVVLGWYGHGLAEREPQLVADWRDLRTAKPFWSLPPTGGPDAG